jgi:heptosyltransferase-2
MKILIELPSWIGDSVMATPAIENIINHYKTSEIILIGPKISIELFSQHPRVSKTHILKKSYFDLIICAKEMGRVKMFFSFRGSLRSKIFKILLKSKDKFQFNKKKYLKQHQVEKYNSFVNDCLKLNNIPGPLVLHQKQNLRKGSRKILGINPGATYGSAKRWYPKEFAKVASALSTEFDIIIFGSTDEKNIANEIAKLLTINEVSNFKNLSGSTSITELVSEISNLDFFITGDSGPMHIAASFNIPTISIFGPTKHDETSQWMNNTSINLKKNLPCQPCMKRVCPLGHHDCMKLIKSKDVLEAVELIQ